MCIFKKINICVYIYIVINHFYTHPLFFLKSQLESAYTVQIRASTYPTNHNYYTFPGILFPLS